MGVLLFGTLEHHAMIPPKRITMVLCLRILDLIFRGPHSGIQPSLAPRSDACTSLDVAIPRGITHGPTRDTSTYSYYIFGYIGNYHYYCFDFLPNNNHDDIISRDNTIGHLVIRVYAIPWDGDLPIDMASPTGQ